MESIDSIIGIQNVLELAFDSRWRQIDAEHWDATLRRREYDENDEEVDEGSLLASARLVRVNLNSGQWFESLDAESGDLAEIGAAIDARSILNELDGDSLFADSLLIVESVVVVEAHRGSRLSHAFVRGIAHIFRSDIVALLPDNMSIGESGDLIVDVPKLEGLRRHWAAGGFIQVPETEVMILPLGNR